MNFLAQSRFGATKEIVEDNVGRLQRVSFSPHGLAHLCQMVKDFEQRSFSNDLDGIECETRLHLEEMCGWKASQDAILRSNILTHS